MQTFASKSSGVSQALQYVLVGLLVATMSGQTATPASSGQEIVRLSAFSVNAEKDQGYRIGNATTATRIGAEIINTPLNIAVVSGELIEELNIRQFGETMNYVTGAITDKVFPDGDFIRIRGQPIGAPFRNGFRRPLSNTTENIERVEVVKGPSTVFFGEGNPGGIVNYITKKPELKNAAALEYTFGSYHYRKFKLDAQARLGDRAGIRVIGAHEDSGNWIDFSYHRAKYANVALLARPSKAWEIVVDYEMRRSRMNDGFMNLTSNRQFHLDYDNPPADIQAVLGMNAAQLRNRWRIAVNTWALDVERTRGNRPFTINENVNDFTPRRRRLNLGGPEFFEQRDVDGLGGDVKFHAAAWLDLRYAFNWLDGHFDEYDLPPTTVNGDRTVRIDNLRGAPYDTTAKTHQLDLLLKYEASWGTHKLLVGAEHDRSDNITRSRAYNFNNLAPVTDRAGAILTGINIYRFWDPFLHQPVRLSQIDAGLGPTYTTSDATRRAGYATHQGVFFSGRLHTMIGLRRTEFSNVPGTQAGRRPKESISKAVPMYGLNFRLAPGFVLFGSISENFIPTIAREGEGPGIRPGEDNLLPPEQGAGWDIGIKTDWKDNRVSGTLSVFQLDRKNIVINDIVRRESDPRNLDNDPNNNVTFRASSGLERSQGVELDFVISATERLQFLAGYSHMWEAAQVSNPSLLPGTYEHRILIGRRLRSAPLHTFNTLGRYRFADGRLKGLSVGLGVRYIGEHEALSQNAAFDLENAASTVVDAFANYRTQIAGQRVNFGLSVDNLFDEVYVVGNRHYGDPFKIFFRTKLDW